MQNKQVKQATVVRNIEERSKRSNAQQIAELDKRLGVGVGAKKEREKLLNPS